MLDEARYQKLLEWLTEERKATEEKIRAIPPHGQRTDMDEWNAAHWQATLHTLVLIQHQLRALEKTGELLPI